MSQCAAKDFNLSDIGLKSGPKMYLPGREFDLNNIKDGSEKTGQL